MSSREHTAYRTYWKHSCSPRSVAEVHGSKRETPNRLQRTVPVDDQSLLSSPFLSRPTDDALVMWRAAPKLLRHL